MVSGGKLSSREADTPAPVRNVKPFAHGNSPHNFFPLFVWQNGLSWGHVLVRRRCQEPGSLTCELIPIRDSKLL